VPDRSPFRGGTFTELPKGGGRVRHHLLPRDSLRTASLRLGVKLDPDYAPAVTMEPSDHDRTSSSGFEAEDQEWRDETAELIVAGRWNEALDRERADVERIAPGKYTEALNEAEIKGKALWPGRRHDQLELAAALKGEHESGVGPGPGEPPEPEDQEVAAAERTELEGSGEGAEQLELEYPKEERILYRGRRPPPGVTPELVDEWLKADQDRYRDPRIPPNPDDRDRGIGE
jgi:hypothetical protein